VWLKGKDLAQVRVAGGTAENREQKLFTFFI
jgi:hypothetical protein